jgi:ribosomal protein S18 acetylase RimI-like enzyme
VNYLIRPATPQDEEILWQMLYEAAHMEEAGETMETAKANPSLAKYAQAWGQPHDLGVVAWTESDQRPAGAAWLRLFQGEQRGYGYMNDETPELAIATLPDHRGQGLGTLLMIHLLAEARQKYPAISLSVRAENPAVHLYERFGFKLVPGSQLINRVGTVSQTMVLDFVKP